LWSGGNVSEGGSTYTKAKFREGGCLIAGEEQEFSCLNGKHGLITGREAVIASRRSFHCRRTVSLWRESGFLSVERKKQKGKKTQYYLIRLQPFQYISSLFPTGEQESYTFDYEQKLYRLERKSIQ